MTMTPEEKRAEYEEIMGTLHTTRGLLMGIYTTLRCDIEYPQRNMIELAIERLGEAMPLVRHLSESND